MLRVFLFVISVLAAGVPFSAICKAQEFNEKIYSVGHHSLLKAVLSKEIRERIGISDEQWKTFATADAFWNQFEPAHLKAHLEKSSEMVKAAGLKPETPIEFQRKMEAFRKERDREYSDTKSHLIKKVFAHLLPHQKQLLKQLTFQQHFQSGTPMSFTFWRFYDGFLEITERQKLRLKKITEKTKVAQRDALWAFDSLRDKRIIDSLPSNQRKLYRCLSRGTANEILSSDEFPRILRSPNSRIYQWLKSTECEELLDLSEDQTEVLDRFRRHLSAYENAKSMLPVDPSKGRDRESEPEKKLAMAQKALQQHESNLREVWACLLDFQRCKLWQADFQYFVETYGLFNTLTIYYRIEFQLSNAEVQKANQVGINANFEFKEAIYEALETDLDESLEILTGTQRAKVSQLKKLVLKQKPGGNARRSIDEARSQKRRSDKNLHGQ